MSRFTRIADDSCIETNFARSGCLLRGTLFSWSQISCQDACQSSGLPCRPCRRCKKLNWTLLATRGARTYGSWLRFSPPSTATTRRTRSAATRITRLFRRPASCRSIAPPRCWPSRCSHTATASSSNVSRPPANLFVPTFVPRTSSCFARLHVVVRQ